MLTAGEATSFPIIRDAGDVVVDLAEAKRRGLPADDKPFAVDEPAAIIFCPDLVLDPKVKVHLQRQWDAIEGTEKLVMATGSTFERLGD